MRIHLLILALTALTTLMLTACSNPRYRDPEQLASTSPTLEHDEIHFVIGKQRDAIRTCYQQLLSRQPGAEGRTVLDLVVAPAGNVSSAKIESSEVTDVDYQNCILAAFRQLVFRATSSPTTIKYPIVVRK